MPAIPAALAAVCCIAAKSHSPALSCQTGATAHWPPADLMLGAAVVAQGANRKRAEQRAAVFSNLGRRLSAARAPKEAAQIILDAADALWQWDASVLDLCSGDLAVESMGSASRFPRIRAGRNSAWLPDGRWNRARNWSCGRRRRPSRQTACRLAIRPTRRPH